MTNTECEYAECGAPVPQCPAAVERDCLRARVAELESDLAAKAELIEMLLADKREKGGDYIGKEEAQEALQVSASAGVPVEPSERQS